MLRTDLQLPFGAVYFRKSNPPRDDWARDYKVAAEDGMNIFRHWFMWGSIERAPGRFDWSDYDRQLDLAAENGIKTVIAELIHAVPDWAYRKFAHARQLRSNGQPLPSLIGVSSATGGFSNNQGGAGALTLNCPEVREAAGAFLTELANRYKNHPALYGYDVSNECNYHQDVDFSAYTKAVFREWLRAKYGSLDALAEIWHRYSYAEWDDIEPPPHLGPYPECLDWLQFRRDDFYRQVQWRIDTIRAAHPDVMICAHGISGAIPNMASNGCDDWVAASKVEVYGFTWVQARKGAEAWKNFYGVDIVRAASRGKPFWHAERQGGPLWLQPQVIGRDKEDGRVATAEDIRLWTMTSFAGGARGVLNLRWRPLLDGALFGAFGAYGMDGERTPRSELQSAIGKWGNAPAQADLWAAKPVRGEVGILVIREAQDLDYLLMFDRAEKPYPAAMWGAYRGFLDNGVQPDWVLIDHIDDYDFLYCPIPIMLTAAQAARLIAWVERGGTLISEACPGYFGDHGHVGAIQPNNGLDRLFGVREDEVEFMPDIGHRYGFSFNAMAVDGAGLLQSYTPQGGTARGAFADGRIAVVEHHLGAGRTLLIGSNPSAAYYAKSSRENLRFYAELFAWSGRERHVTLSNPNVFARLHRGAAGAFLWLVNPTTAPQVTSAKLAASHGTAQPRGVCWPAGGALDGLDALTVGAKDVLIVAV